ncbi:MAG: TIR domain-containing protein, partial [Bacteroidales bacterium]|nr:TIR domain-containing protein [Bacteroidales bacterium]
MEEQMKYYAFISYNSADEKWAKWLQHKLEYYHVPSALCKEYPELPKKIRPVFWYKQDLSGTKLKEALSKELRSSKYLIVICSPDSAKSVWVNDEIASFIEQGKDAQIIPFIVRGEPHSKNPDNECFPPALLGLKRDEEIRGIDVRRKEGKSHALVDVIATMFGIRFDELWGRHRQRLIRQLFLSILSLIAVFAICAFWRISVKNEQITQAKFIAAEAEKLAENGDAYDAVRLLIHVCKNNKESSKVADFIHVARCVDANYTIPKKEFKHQNDINSAVFSSDGRFVVTASSDHTSKLWSVESGECIVTMNHNDDVNSAVFSPDGRYVVTASGDKTSKLWSVESGECLMTMNHENYVKSASFSPDGRYVVTASGDKTSKLWSVESGECLMTMNHEEGVKSASFSPDGRYVVTASWDKTSKLWSVESGECIMTMNHNDDVNSAVFSPDGRYVVTASGDKTSKLWSVE